MDLRKLNVKGFHLSKDCSDHLSSIYYDSDDDPDGFYITITNDTENPNVEIVSITQNCEVQKITTFDEHSIHFLEYWLNSTTNSMKE